MQLQPPPLAGQPEARYQQLWRLLEEGSLPVAKLASCMSEARVDPQASMMPGLEMFYRALSEVIYSRYGLKGTIRRAVMGEEPQRIHNSLILCSMNVNRMAEQAIHLLDLMQQGAAPSAQPLGQSMRELFEQERANFRQIMAQINTIMGEDARAARQRVMQAIGPIHVQGGTAIPT